MQARDGMHDLLTEVSYLRITTAFLHSNISKGLEKAIQVLNEDRL